jgi:hypothetical protein
MKAGFDGENPIHKEVNLDGKVNLFCRFPTIGAGKPKTCNANKEKTTPNKTEDCSRKYKENHEYTEMSKLPFSYYNCLVCFKFKMLFQY